MPDSALPERMLVVDIETTGSDPKKHGIVQIGAALVNESLEVIKTLNSRCNPGPVDIDPLAMAVHGIPRNEISSAVPIENVLFLLTNFCESDPLLCTWGPYFDRNFLTVAFERSGLLWPLDHQVFDAKSAVHGVLFARGEKMEYGGLSNYVRAFNLKPPKKFHDALSDVLTTIEVMKAALLP